MRQLGPQISEDIAPEVFALAARLYAEKNQSYSLAELAQAGAGAQIPPEFIQQAVAEIQAKHIRAQILRSCQEAYKKPCSLDFCRHLPASA